jgi:hypothetical protein
MFKKNVIVKYLFALVLASLFIVWISYIINTFGINVRIDILSKTNSVATDDFILNSQSQYDEIPPIAPTRSKVTLHFDAARLSNLTNGAPVKIWPDSSRNGFTIKSLTAGNNPKYKYDPNEKLSSVEFKGNDFLEIFDIEKDKLLNPENTNIFLIFKSNAPANYPKIMDVFGWGNCETHRLLLHAFPLNKSLQFHFGAPKFSVDAQLTDQNLNQPLLLGIRLYKGKIEISVNGMKVSEGAIDLQNNLLRRANFMLGTSLCNNVFYGEIFELAIVKNLSTVHYYRNMKYFLDKYSL